MKLPASFIKKYGLTKRAWAEFRKSKGGAKRAAPKKHHKKKRRVSHEAAAKKPGRSSGQHGGKMAKKKRRVGRKAKVAVRRAGRRAKAAMGSRPGQILMMAGTATAGALGTSMAINAVFNNIDSLKTKSAGWKSGAQFALGLLGVYFGKKRWIKNLGAGAVLGGVLGGVKSVTGVDPLAGPSAGRPTISPEQLRRLIASGGRMNIPANVRTMNMPANVTMRGPIIPGNRSKGFGGMSF